MGRHPTEIGTPVRGAVLLLLLLLLLPPLGSSACALSSGRGGRLPYRPTVEMLLLSETSPRFLVCGHRGDLFGSLLREGDNTIAAFARAVGEGVDLVEVDVQATADGVPVIRHGSEVRDRTLAAWRGAGVEVLTLREALDWARGRVVLVLDLKTKSIDKVVVEVLAADAAAGAVFYAHKRREYDDVRAADRGVFVMVRARSHADVTQWLAEGDPRIVMIHGDADWLTPAIVEEVRRTGRRVFANSYRAVWHQDVFGGGSGARELFEIGVDVAQTNDTAGACRARDEALARHRGARR